MSEPTKENITTACQEAAKDLEELKQANLKVKIQSIIKATLEKIEATEAVIDERREANKRDKEVVAILKADLKDLEAGRLDLIEERQAKDENAKGVSVAWIKQVISENPYEKPWKNMFDIVPTLSCDFADPMTTSGTSFTTFAPGTYALASGTVRSISPFNYY